MRTLSFYRVYTNVMSIKVIKHKSTPLEKVRRLRLKRTRDLQKTKQNKR